MFTVPSITPLTQNTTYLFCLVFNHNQKCKYITVCCLSVLEVIKDNKYGLQMFFVIVTRKLRHFIHIKCVYIY